VTISVLLSWFVSFSSDVNGTTNLLLQVGGGHFATQAIIVGHKVQGKRRFRRCQQIAVER